MDKFDETSSRVTYSNEITLLARAQRMRSEYVGAWLRRLFRGKASAPVSAPVDFARSEGLFPQRS